MSIRAMVWAVEQDLPALQKLVLIMLSDRHNGDTGQCNPSLDRVARDCGMSKTAVKESIRSLIDRGLVTAKQRLMDGVNLPNQYELSVGDGVGRHTTEGRAPQHPGVGRHTPPNLESQPVTEPILARETKPSPDSDLFGQGNKSGDREKDSLPPEPPAPPSQGTAWEQAFEAAYTMFPTQRKGAQDGALRAWKAAKKRHPDLQPGYMLARIKAYKDGEEVERGFAKGMAAWLNDDRWTFDYSRKPFGSVRSPTDGQMGRFAGRVVDDPDKIRRQNAEAEAEMGHFHATSTRPGSATR